MGRENLAGVAAVLENTLAPLVAAGALDVELDAEAGELEAIAEEWTLHLEGWPQQPLAWLALDDEPDNPGEVPAALLAVLDPTTLTALARADWRLGGDLVAALRAVHDPLSDELAETLEALRPQTEFP
jgi:hypothetical protein